MNPENSFEDPRLEEAAAGMREQEVDPEVLAAAAARVWARLEEATRGATPAPAEHIRTCADFQALIPEFRAGRLSEARSLLLQDHLHECVACRRVFEGRVVMMAHPEKKLSAPSRYYVVRWAAAAGIVLAAGVAGWMALNFGGSMTGRATVQAVNGTLYLVTAEGLHPLAAGQDLPDGAEIRSAKDSDALLRLRDGSLVELRERSSFSTSRTAADVTVHLGRGSVIVQAAKRRSGHLYVDTADCRVAVTGTIFSVSAGAKGSRVSVVQGEVHVAQGSGDRVLRPGQQAVTGEDLDSEPVRADIAWSRNRERYDKLLEQLANLRADLETVHLPDLRYNSRLLAQLPGDTVFYAGIPNLGTYLGEAQAAVKRNLEASPELRNWAGGLSQGSAILERLRAGSEYLGDEIAVVGVEGARAPVFLAEVKRDGFAGFLNQAGVSGLAMESRNGLVVFGPDREAVGRVAPALDRASGGFEATPFYRRIRQAYAEGAGLLLCADLERLGPSHAPASGMRYLIAEEKEIRQQVETRATFALGGERTGLSAWLADPAPMGSLDYISNEATAMAAFVVRNPAAIFDQLASLAQKTPGDLGAQAPETQSDLAASVGGEFALGLDGPAFPVPSWRLVVEVYDPARLQSAIDRTVANANRTLAQNGDPALVTAQETLEGRTYYKIAGGRPNPLTEAHYTFSGGYLIAGPTRALVTRALQTKNSAGSIIRSAKFTSMMPRDHYANFSAVIYQNLGQTLAPLTGLLGGFAGPNADQQQALARLGNMKPLLVAAYNTPESLAFASTGDLLGMGLTNLVSGNLAGFAGGVLPIGQVFGTPGGTHGRNPAYR
jgi:ferric-dicitrate binding protein FerR (iron transport regulator)